MAVLGGQLGDLPLPRMCIARTYFKFLCISAANLFTDHPANSNSSFEPGTVAQASTCDRSLTESQITYLTLGCRAKFSAIEFERRFLRFGVAGQPDSENKVSVLISIRTNKARMGINRDTPLEMLRKNVGLP
jgi:hypothetical protein